MHPNPLGRAISDLFWGFFPIFLILFILMLVGRLSSIAERSDLILSASVLFAEGWARSRRLPTDAQSYLSFFGFIGALVTAILASLMLLVEVGQITQLSNVINSVRFAVLHWAMLIFSLLYGLLVRAIVYANEGYAGPPYR